MTAIINDNNLTNVVGAYSYKPDNVGEKVDQYQVRVDHWYYYHYTGGGYDQWLPIYITAVYEKTKVLWFTERFADVKYESGMTGSLPLDTGDIYYIA